MLLPSEYIHFAMEEYCESVLFMNKYHPVDFFFSKSLIKDSSFVAYLYIVHFSWHFLIFLNVFIFIILTLSLAESSLHVGTTL